MKTFFIFILFGLGCNTSDSEPFLRSNSNSQSDQSTINNSQKSTNNRSSNVNNMSTSNVTGTSKTTSNVEPVCGNDLSEIGEECDDNDDVLLSCKKIDKMFNGGYLTCENCQLSTKKCEYCGDGKLGENEECEGDNFGQKTCSSNPTKPYGKLLCNNECQRDDSSCEKGYVQMSAGNDHTCALLSDGQLKCWGRNNRGQIEIKLTNDIDSFTKVSTGSDHTCALTKKQHILCWGFNRTGQLNVPSGNYIDVELGGEITCALDADNIVKCWGAVEEFNPPSLKYKAITVGRRHACGLRSTNKVECWGGFSFVVTNTPSVKMTQISAGGDHTCGLTTKKEVLCWGKNKDDVLDAPPGKFEKVFCSARRCCAIDDKQVGHCWGKQPFGIEDVLALDEGKSHSCTILLDGTIECQGPNEYGQNNVPLVN